MESNKQEKSNLLKDNPVAKMASGGSWMSKHVSPISMGKAHSGMQPKMESPVEKELIGGQKNLPEALQKAIEASPAEMNNSAVYKQGYNAKLDESLGAKNGKKSQSLGDRRDESKGMEKSKGKGAYSSDSKMS